MARRTGEKDGGQRASAQVSTKNRSGVTAVRESRRRSSVACLCGHRPASGDAGVGADTTFADPGSALTRHPLTPMASAVSSTIGTEREAAAAKPKRTRERLGGGSTATVRNKGWGGIPTPCADRDDRRSVRQPRAVTALREAAGAAVREHEF
jgi:hypothetical protein